MVAGGIVIGFPFLTSFALTTVPAAHGAVVIALLPAATPTATLEIDITDARSPRDGRFIEKIGTYNPLLPKDSAERVTLDTERASHWLSVGAQPSDRVARFLDAAGLRTRAARSNPSKGEPGEKAKERAEVKAQKAADAAEAAAEAAAAPAVEEVAAEEPAVEVAAEAPAEEAAAEQAEG